ncbi:MAG: hypothetical protein ABJP79_03050 [Tateyamaria sp.]|uniref:DUF6931 family protein n=1 Tax=Tateyamaria sp. TaxID=1929288 RepID=UPI00329AD90C
MSKRFENLKKVPDQPASRLLAAANAQLKTKLSAPANASVQVVLKELEAARAPVDMLRLLSVSLPPRECVWWACIAGRDVLQEDEKSICLTSAEAWVFEPTVENRERLRLVLENESAADNAAPCATAAYYAPGNLGEGDMADIPAPIGVVSACCFGMNLKTLKVGPPPEHCFEVMIDRALDIARGGNGKIELVQDSTPAPTTEGTA